MTLRVHKVDQAVWKELGASTHQIVFGENPPETQSRMDFALVVQDLTTDLYVTYVTVRELDSDTVYWGWGGAFPTFRNSSAPWRAYQAMTETTFELGYKSIFTLIENTNAPMLKFALKMGYKIIGIRHVNGCTMLEHLLEKAVE